MRNPLAMISDLPFQELSGSGIGLPARSSRRMRIAADSDEEGEHRDPGRDEEPLEKPTANAWR